MQHWGTDTEESTPTTVGSMDVTQFIGGALLEDATIVDCTLSGGAEGVVKVKVIDTQAACEDDVRGYHYHAASAWENTFIGSFTGQFEGDDAAAGGGRPPR